MFNWQQIAEKIIKITEGSARNNIKWGLQELKIEQPKEINQ